MQRDEVVEQVGAQFLDDRVVLRVHEMTGKAGDIWLLHPLLGHCGTPNASGTPRMMRSKLAMRDDFDWWSE